MSEKLESSKIAIFKGKQIRKTIYNNEWWFCLNDVIEVLADSNDPAQYFKRMKVRDSELNKLINGKGGVQIVPPLMLKMKSVGGVQNMYCWHTEGIFRLVQSIPSPKAEPFKRWLAKTGYERVQEIENPELASQRIRMLYKAKGYSDSWIEKRMHSIAIREKLTNEWQERGAKENKEYEILTAEISKATFGVTPSEYKGLKKLKRENLRDHMTDLELIFTMLGEAATTEIHQDEDSKGFCKLKKDAKKGGKGSGVARVAFEKERKTKVVTSNNFLELQKNKEIK